MPKRVLGIDIGSYSLKLIQLQGTLKGYTVRSVQEHRWMYESPSPPAEQKGPLAGPSRDTAGGLLPHPFTHRL
ncbi:MAG: hypothetical protein D6736_15405 [Nitrospinota bacterium]|nr:MAG: hypothetical protein D6736_15405 [Nitrospinota bacterium]